MLATLEYAFDLVKILKSAIRKATSTDSSIVNNNQFGACYLSLKF